MKIMIEIDEKKVREMFNSASSNGVRVRLAENEITNQCMSQGVLRLKKEFAAWSSGRKSMLSSKRR